MEAKQKSLEGIAMPIMTKLYQASRKRDFFIDDLLVRIHFIIEMVSVDRPCAMRI